MMMMKRMMMKLIPYPSPRRPRETTMRTTTPMMMMIIPAGCSGLSMWLSKKFNRIIKIPIVVIILLTTEQTYKFSIAMDPNNHTNYWKELATAGSLAPLPVVDSQKAG
jgi:hypothetical protein